MSDITKKVEYRIDKVTFARKMCSFCGGTGKVEGKLKTNNCPYCVNGVATIEHQTSVSLMDALQDLGLIKTTGK
ncbi:MAG: hypothetical protein ABFD76_10095 [Smithella sp.]